MTVAPATRDKARTRRAILDAAEEAFASSGSSSLADIAASAGVSKSGLLHHFASRDELLLAVAQDGVEKFRRSVFDRVDLSENRAGKLLRGYVRAMCEPDEVITATFSVSPLGVALRGVPGVAELQAADDEWWREQLAADGLPVERVLVVRFAAEGVAGALSTWIVAPDDLVRVRAELLRLAEPDGNGASVHPRPVA
ncbi:TetR/AcrR family transcriptional regulator [Pseudolysinimonas sp.]